MLKIHPDLALAALRDNQDRLYRVWVLARSLDPQGSSRVEVTVLQAAIEEHGLKGLSPGTLRRLLKRGEGTWWERGGGCLWLHSLYRICEALHVEKLSHSPANIPWPWIKSLKVFRSACYASMFPSGSFWSNPISRKALEKLTGKTGRTQRNYDKALGEYIEKQDNVAMTGISLKHGTEIPDGYFVDKIVVNGEEVIVLLKRLPNSFRTEFTKAARGMTRKVNQQLRQLFCQEKKSTRERLFYQDAKAAHRRIQRAKENDWFAVQGAEISGHRVSKTRGGRVLWTPVQMCDTQVFFT